MTTPHNRRSRPYDPKDRDRLDQRPKPQMIVTPGMRGPRVMVFMPGDFGRALKVIGAVLFGLLTYVRFSTSTSLLIFIVIVFAVLAIAVVWASAITTLTKLDFVRANEFADPHKFVRRAKLLHATEVVAAGLWVIWLGFSFGGLDWIPIAIVVATVIFAFFQRWRLGKMSQPRNIWER